MKTKYNYTDKNTATRNVQSRDGKTIYAIMVDGSRRRVSPVKPWKGKSERRQVIKNRREDRELAAANK